MGRADNVLNFIKKHWLGLGLGMVAGLLLLFDPVRNLVGAGLSAGAAVLSFIERFLAGGKGTIGQSDASPARQIDDNLDVLQRTGSETERATDEAIAIVERAKAKNRKG